ncbi:hypothetical protein DC083_03675 [Ignatzschineria ureiclastica]|uniref:AB hydrolase-1 domain-containing protein n=1 Tax=Ignatzschineria ureiclastica TaxID=472582 RepID=A0A2U2AFY8_9GAMM|nr:alpha/beta fold hydrolase [Ignatzschineria ureiclastica]PWD81550.1 hypothetical protein DC083_03675 [Ignatzschineria ureiclastica]GHA01576.1 acetyltransferase [Ignatzschineria ureiclastica]
MNEPSTVNQFESKDHTALQDLILIHGLYQNSWVMRILGKRLNQLGYRVYYFDYPTLRADMNDNIELFHQYLQTFTKPYAIITHSLGGLITYQLAHQYQPTLLQKVIAITPPFQGSDIAQYLVDHHADYLLGKAKTALLKRNNKLKWELSTIPLGVIAGTQNIGPSHLLLEQIVRSHSHDEPSDGTVYLKETQIEGMTDFITINRSHTMILFDNRIPLLCDHFLRYNSFSLQ